MRQWVVGRNPVYEVFRANRRQVFRLLLAQGVEEKGRIADIVRYCTGKKIIPERVPRKRLDTFGGVHQGVALEVSDFSYCGLPDILALAKMRSELPFLLLLDALQDPQNLGTLLRSAECVGVHGVLLPLRHTATITPAVVSASSGASEHMLISQVNLAQAINTLKEAGVWTVGLDSQPKAGGLEPLRLGGPVALVVGNEGQGLRPLVRDSCDVLMHLPMRGKVESLNAAVAGSVALYLLWQARGFGSSG